ncbi:MAG: MoaD/ThiS family protein [Nitrososphaerota archaeon]|nr:MoaD/ThiS family protein [Aigarchaeota archaeon]MDW8076636.1 MoaD/ThiS family protein [Nitrososphaerota archaeon]
MEVAVKKKEVVVKFMGVLRDTAGPEMSVTIKDDSRISDVLQEVQKKLEPLMDRDLLIKVLRHSRLVLNGVYAPDEAKINPGDVLMIISPAAGG